MSTPPRRIASIVILTTVLVFVGLMIPAMQAYPGGTSWDHATHGGDFWLNYLCDFGRETALNGEPNLLGAELTQVAMLVLAFGLFQIFWRVPQLLPAYPRLGLSVRVLGTIGIAGTLGVALLPADRYGSLHAIAIVLAGVPSLLAATLAVVGLALEGPRPGLGTVCGGAMTLVSCVDFALFVEHLSCDGPGPTAVAVLERVALLLVLVWMCAMAARLRRAHPSGGYALP